MIKKVIQPYSILNPEPKKSLGYILPSKPSFFGTASKRTYDYRGLAFDGVDDYVAAGNNASLNFGTKDFTISLWNLLNSGVAPIMSGGSKNDLDNGWYIEKNSAFIAVRFKYGGVMQNDDTWIDIGSNTGQWEHLVIVRDTVNSKLRVYLNSVLRKTYSSINVVNINDTAPLWIGDDNRYPPFNGSIDEVRIYNRALSASEITQLYNHIDPSRYGLVLEHNYRTGTATDFSGCGNHGTVYGAVYQ